MEFFYKPQEDVSYDFIASMYSVGLAIAVVLALLDLQFQIEEVKGFWIIFAPFSVCFLWAMLMRRAAKSKSISNAKKED
jgi:F0F1-type ATP synthase assembly protein I